MTVEERAEAGEGSSILADGTRATPPSAQEAERADAAQEKLAAQGYDVSVKTFWWGFEIHLNAEAAEVAGDIADLIGDVAGNVLPSPMGEVVEGYCKIKSVW